MKACASAIVELLWARPDGTARIKSRLTPANNILRDTIPRVYQAFINSRIDIRVEGGLTTWRVLAGRIQVAMRTTPQHRVNVTAGQRIVVSRARLERPLAMPQQELQELNRHFLHLRVSPMVPVEPRTAPPVLSPPVRTEPPPPPVSAPVQPRTTPPVLSPPARTEPAPPPLPAPIHPRTESPAIQPRIEPSVPPPR